MARTQKLPKARKNAQRRSFPDTVNLVYQKVYWAEAPMTRLEICRALGRAGKQPFILKAIEHLVAIKWIEQKPTLCKRNGHMVYAYTPIKYDEKGNRIG